jgi:amidohydrolase
MAGIALGAAMGLAPFKCDLPGRLIVLGTPAEEGGGGKLNLIREGAFEGISAALIVHPGSHTFVDKGFLAVSEVHIAYRGKAAHASVDPEQGINALAAVILLFNGVDGLRQHMRDGARIHGIITDGGTKPNIVPEHAAARFYVRAETVRYRDELVDRVQRCAEGAALATGAELQFRMTGHAYKNMRVNRALAERFSGHLETLGYPVDATPGGMGSTDMGDVSWEVPAIHPQIRVTDRPVPLHSREFAEAARSDTARRAMVAAAKAVAATCLDLWHDQQLAREVRREFEAH